MGIGAISGFGQMMNLQSSYKINSVYGNPKAMQPVDKIGEEQYSGNPFAVVSKKDEEDIARINNQQSKPFDFDAAMKRAEQNMTTAPGAETKINLGDEMARLMQGTRFSAETIPVAEIM